VAEEARLWRGLEEARVQEERRIDIKKHQKASPFLAASPDRLLILA
jgi:hypothetical protein